MKYEIIEERQGNFTISSDPQRLQLERIHHYLSQESYWCVGIPRETVKKAIENSLNFAVYDEASTPNGIQVGFARVVTDSATFAWICDVYIEKEYRGHGLSKSLIRVLLSHPQLQGLRRICLGTLGAHGLYEKFGFKVTATPTSWMEIKDNDIYKKNK